MSKKHAHRPKAPERDHKPSTPAKSQKAASKGIDPRMLLTLIGAAFILGVVFMALRGGSTTASASGAVPIPEKDGVQKMTIEANGAFSPSEISAKAGVPIELTYGPGIGCSQAVKFPDLGVAEDIRGGNTVVKLPALQKGTYQILCQSDMDMGTLYVE